MRLTKTRHTPRLLAGIMTLATLGTAALVQAAPAKVKVKLSAKQATSIAKKKYPGKVTKPAVLEQEDGKWQYAIMIQSGKVLREVTVDANTGATDAEVTTEAKEAAEAKAEAAAKKPGAKTPDKEADEKDEKDEKNEKH